jgi:hypothetical protein
LGYQFDGIYGYIFRKITTVPRGTVAQMRKYSTPRDQHGVFPENQTPSYASQGYTEISGSPWLGYVYANTNG